LDKIEFLQGHQNEKIYKKAFQIIENYFGQEEEDTGLIPDVNAQSQEFKFGLTNPPNSAAPQGGPSGGFKF
jgi:hypothetical protein